MSITKFNRLLLAGGIVVFSAISCYWIGKIQGYEKRLIEDYQHSVYVLVQLRPEAASPLKEFLKAQSYYLSHKVPTKMLLKQGDFGEVDSKLLGVLQPISDSIDYKGDYEQLRGRLYLR